MTGILSEVPSAKIGFCFDIFTYVSPGEGSCVPWCTCKAGELEENSSFLLSCGTWGSSSGQDRDQQVWWQASLHWVVCSFILVNLTLRCIWEEEVSIEQSTSSDWPADTPVGHFSWLMIDVTQPTVGSGTPGHVVLDGIRT